MENFNVKSYTRKTKSGKTVTIKAHKRSREGSKSNVVNVSGGVRAKSGEELATRKEAAMKLNALGLYEGDVQTVNDIDREFNNLVNGELKDVYRTFTPSEKLAFYNDHVRQNLNKPNVWREKKQRISGALDKHLKEKGSFSDKDLDSALSKIDKHFSGKAKSQRKPVSQVPSNPAGSKSSTSKGSDGKSTKKGDDLMVRVGNNMFGKAAVKVDNLIQRLEERNKKRRR